ncbi:MAG: hypothetical protein WCD45_07400 [Gallionella sp.]
MNKYLRMSATVLFLLAGNAKAEIPMQVRERVQTIVWVLEALTVATIFAVFWFVWRYSQRAREKNKADRKALSE